MMTTISFPSYPEFKISISLFNNIPKNVLERVKNELIAGNPDFDYCFLNTDYLVSTQQLRASIYKAVEDYHNSNMRAKTLNTEIIFNLSPINNIKHALETFGINIESPKLIVIKVFKNGTDKDLDDLKQKLNKILPGAEEQEFNDANLFENSDISKLKKLYKLNDAVIELNQSNLTKLIICSCQLRGIK